MEAQATTALIDKGCDVFTCHVDSPQVVVEMVEHAGKMVCGYYVNQAALAPKGYLTGAELNWDKVFVDVVEKVQRGEKVDSCIGGFKAGVVKMSPYGKLVSAQAKKDADAAKEKFLKGDLIIFKGPLSGTDDVGKKVTIPEGTKYKLDDPNLEHMNYLVEGVLVGK